MTEEKIKKLADKYIDYQRRHREWALEKAKKAEARIKELTGGRIKELTGTLEKAKFPKKDIEI